MSFFARRRRRRIGAEFVALLSALALTAGLGVNAAAADTKPYTATWVSGGTPVLNPPNQTTLASGTTSAVLRIKNLANPQSLGSANITVPTGYSLIGGSLTPAPGSATKAGNTLELRNLGLASSASVDVTINVRTPCIDNQTREWTLVVKQANNFSGPPGNNFTRLGTTAAPFSTVGGSACLLRFANQPSTTQTGEPITDGFDSGGNAIRVEIYDPGTGLTVDSNASVTLAPAHNPALGTLTGGVVNASAGVATFPALSLNKPGPYTLRASSPAASNTEVSDQFMVSDTVTECDGAGCSFTEQQGLNSYTTTPEDGVDGANWVTSLNLPGLRISCDFGPFDYPDSRQPNAVWYVYDDGNTDSGKTNVIVIDKEIVQLTPENGTSKYRVCYSSPERFTDRTGNPAQQDPGAWNTSVPGTVGPSEYFGTTWYTGLLPDCAKKAVAPCVLSWTGDGGNRTGTFLTPPGDPSYR
jgi:hypothetical protein